jgi:GAF domain-containing protein
MPYLRCHSCGVTSYAPRTGGSCPECGAPLGAHDSGGDPDRRLDALLRLTRELLDADVAILSEIHDRREVVIRAVGEWAPTGSLDGSWMALDDTICKRLLDGRISNVIADTAADARVRDLRSVRRFGIGAWIGIALTPSDGELYMLCCLSHEARPSLGDREVRLLRGLAESLLVELRARRPLAA